MRLDSYPSLWMTTSFRWSTIEYFTFTFDSRVFRYSRNSEVLGTRNL